MRKRLLAALLALALWALPALAEDAGATLRLSSFSGDGYVYTVAMEDPDIAACETRYESGERGEPVSGEPCVFTVTFTGLRPGGTRAVVFGRSPILENEDRIYALEVDGALRVTATPVREITLFSFARMIEGGYRGYRVTLEEDGYRLSVDEGPQRPFPAEAAEELLGLIDARGLPSWDGFSETNANVLDGESFWLEFRLGDGSRVQAMGDNAFPPDYGRTADALWSVLTRNEEE